MNKKKHILIFTEMDDLHTDDMIKMLKSMGHEAIRLNTNFIPLSTSMTFDLKDSTWQGNVELSIGSRSIDVEDIRSIWWRRPGLYSLPTDLSLQEREFARIEIDEALRGLWASLDCYWISYPEYIRQASWKMEQLQRASHIGFSVPRTLVTTSPETVQNFYEACNRKIIFKVLSDPFLAAQTVHSRFPDQPPPALRGTYTTMVGKQELEMLDSIRLTPCLFQEYIPKQFELRVTVIGDEVFAAEIHSQDHEATSIDWRHYEIDIPYRKATLPAEVAERCLALTRSYHLNFSTMDLVFTPDGEYVFIENNANGQFMFIEKRVPELRMTAALASCLIRGANS